MLLTRVVKSDLANFATVAPTIPLAFHLFSVLEYLHLIVLNSSTAHLGGKSIVPLVTARSHRPLKSKISLQFLTFHTSPSGQIIQYYKTLQISVLKIDISSNFMAGVQYSV